MQTWVNSIIVGYRRCIFELNKNRNLFIPVFYKYNCTSIAASFGIVALDYYEQDNAYRRYLCDIYTQRLKDEIVTVPVSPDCLSARHLFQILVNKRDEVMLALGSVGIYPGVHYKANNLFKIFPDRQICPKAEKFSKDTITLPLHMHLTVDDVSYICDKLIEIIKK